jgi:hypothetical protein
VFVDLDKEYYSIIEASKKFKFDEFDLIYLGAFQGLPIYTYVSAIYVEYEKFIDEDEDKRPIFQFDGNKLIYNGYLQLLDFDLKTVYAEKAVNLKIYRFISDVNQINEWVTLDPFDPLIIESLSRLYVKASDIENIINSDDVNESELVNSNSEKIGRRKLQHEVILAIIASLNYDPFKIPDGGKSKIKLACLTRSRIFTSSGFDHAWKEGCSKGLFKLENSEKYSNL